MFGAAQKSIGAVVSRLEMFSAIASNVARRAFLRLSPWGHLKILSTLASSSTNGGKPKHTNTNLQMRVLHGSKSPSILKCQICTKNSQLWQQWGKLIVKKHKRLHSGSLVALVPPDPNCELQIAVGTNGPQLWAPDVSEHCRTSPASSRS